MSGISEPARTQPDPLAAFPSRPLHPLPPISRGIGVRAMLGLLLFAGFLVFCVYWVAPVIVTDWQVRGNAVPIAGGHLSNGSCSGQLFFETCDVDLSAPVGTGTINRSVHYVFAAFHSGDYEARVVADPRHPEWLTTDLGLDYFWDRVVSLVVTCLLLVALLVGGILGTMRTRRTYASWRRANMTAVPLRLLGIQKAGARRVWMVQAENGKQSRWTMPTFAKPFVLGPADRVLGLMMKGGGSIMPLDAKLRWVELSRAERDAVMAAQPRD